MQCDICLQEVKSPDGYLLTTKEVVCAPEYWRIYYNLHKEECIPLGISDYEQFCRAQPVIRTVFTICGFDTPWLVCERCIIAFNVDKPLTKEYAIKWWKSKKWWNLFGPFKPPNTGPAELSDVNMGFGGRWYDNAEDFFNDLNSSEIKTDSVNLNNSPLKENTEAHNRIKISFISLIEKHSNKIKNNDPSSKEELLDIFNEKIIDKLSTIGADNLINSIKDGKEKISSLTNNEILYIVTGFPFGYDLAKQWYQDNYEGYIGYIVNIMNSIKDTSSSVKKICNTILFQIEESLFIQIAIFPSNPNEFSGRLIVAPNELLSDYEKNILK